MISRNLLITFSLILTPACAQYNIKPVQGYLCLYDRREDTAYCQSFTNRNDEKEIKGKDLDGFYMFDSQTFGEFQRFKSDAETALKKCNSR